MTFRTPSIVHAVLVVLVAGSLVAATACESTPGTDTDASALSVAHDDSLEGDGTVDSPLAIAPDGVTSESIEDGTVATADLAASSVTSAQLVDGTVATADLAADSVTTAQIADGNVTNAKLATGIDAAKLTGTVSGATVVVTGPLPLTSSVHMIEGFATTGLGAAGAEYGISCTSACQTRYNSGAMCLAAFVNVSEGSPTSCDDDNVGNRKRCLCTYAP